MVPSPACRPDTPDAPSPGDVQGTNPAPLAPLPDRQPIPAGGLPVLRRIDELNAHPSYARHRIAVSASRLSAVIALGEPAFRIPLVISSTGVIISGYERYAVARDLGRVTIACLEFDVDEDASLRWLIELNRDAEGLNAFQRILLALDLEPKFQDAAAANQRAGGQLKGSLKLATASAVDVRAEIAKVAGVSGANVGKVKYLLTHAIPEIQEGVRDRELSIHRAWLWSKEPFGAQVEMLRLHRLNKGLLQSIQRYASSRRRRMMAPVNPAEAFAPDYSETLLNYLTGAVRLGTVAVMPVNHAGSEIFVPQHLIDAFRIRQEVKSDGA
jgi:hypothetical protein